MEKIKLERMEATSAAGGMDSPVCRYQTNRLKSNMSPMNDSFPLFAGGQKAGEKYKLS